MTPQKKKQPVQLPSSKKSELEISLGDFKKELGYFISLANEHSALYHFAHYCATDKASEHQKQNFNDYRVIHFALVHIYQPDDEDKEYLREKAKYVEKMVKDMELKDAEPRDFFNQIKNATNNMHNNAFSKSKRFDALDIKLTFMQSKVVERMPSLAVYFNALKEYLFGATILPTAFTEKVLKEKELDLTLPERQKEIKENEKELSNLVYLVNSLVTS